MIEFAYPLLALLLPLPLFVRWFASSHHRREDALQAPFFQQLVELTGQTPGEGGAVAGRTRLQWLMITATWLLVVVALCRPQWIGEPIVETQSARDLMIAVDLSGSMSAEDFTDADGNKLSRLDGLKRVLSDFAKGREHDRLGLIVFGSAPYLQVPFTLDTDLFLNLLNETQVRMAGPQTMLGDAIGLSIKHFDSSDTENKVLLLVTDGNDTDSQVPPRRAAKLARQKEVTIHVIAIGDPEAVGEEALDEALMRDVAATTGGQYFHAEDGTDLQRIYQELDALEPIEVKSLSYRPRRDLFYWPLGAGLLISLGLHTWYAIRGART